MQIFRLGLICLISWTLMGLSAGHHGGAAGLGPVGILLGVGLLAKLLQDHGHSSHHHHVQHVYVPYPVHHHGHHHGY